MKKEQYWLITLKAEDLLGGDPFSGKEIAKIIALTSTPKEPEFSTVMDGIMDGFRQPFQRRVTEYQRKKNSG